MTIALTPRQKEKPRGKKKKTHSKMNNLTEKRKRLAAKRKTSRQKEKDLRQKEKPHGKKKKTRGKKKNLTAKRKRLRHGEISPMPRGHLNSYLFCREVVVILFAVTLFFLPSGFSFCLHSCGPPYLWNFVPEDSWFFNIRVFVRTSTNFAHLSSFQDIEFMDWPVPKTLDISVCQTSENKAFKTRHSITRRRTRTRFNLIPSLHVFR